MQLRRTEYNRNAVSPKDRKNVQAEKQQRFERDGSRRDARRGGGGLNLWQRQNRAGHINALLRAGPSSTYFEPVLAELL